MHFQFFIFYYPVIWKFHNRSLKNELNKHHNCCLLQNCNFKGQLEKENTASIHYTKMYKLANGMSPEIMNEIFQPRGESHYSITSVIHINSLFHQYKVLLQKNIKFSMKDFFSKYGRKLSACPSSGSTSEEAYLNRVKIIIYTFIFCLW